MEPEALSQYRDSNPMLVVCQNRERRCIEICGMNESAAAFLGVTREELTGQKLDSILSGRVSDMLAEYIDYEEEDAPDLAEVLGKVRHFSLRPPGGKEQFFHLRIVRIAPKDDNAWFHLILQDDLRKRPQDDFKRVLKDNFKGHETLDAKTHLPDRASLEKDLQLTIFHVGQGKLDACFALFGIDGAESLGGGAVLMELHREVGRLVRQAMRLEDTIGTVNPSALGAVLLDISPESCLPVLHRLRMSVQGRELDIGGGLMKSDTLSLSIVFCPLTGDSDARTIIDRCETQLRELARRGNGQMQLVG